MIAVDVTDFVNVVVNISPMAIPYENFGLPIIAGDSPVIDVVERYRSYTNIDGVATDFGLTAPEYLAAAVFFQQTPRPSMLLIGRWASAATPGLLRGATLTAAQRLLTNFTAVTTGAFKITIDGTLSHDIVGLDFHLAANLNAVASTIQTALRIPYAGATCVWNAIYSRFEITSGTTGTASIVGYGGTAASGVDVSTLLGLTSVSGASPPVVGALAETPLACAAALASQSRQWWGLAFASTVAITDQQHEDVAAYILASSRSRVYGVTIQNAACLDPTQTTDLASVLQSLSNKRVFWQYSSTNPYAVMTIFGRAATVDFEGDNTTITLAYKQAPGVIAEHLNETQFATLVAKGGNVDIVVSNGAQMIWPGQMSNGYWFDEVQGVDWLQNRIETDLFNLLYQTTTKVPQTDGGDHLLATQIEASCAAGIANGLGAPGVWNAAGFGSLFQGDMLTKGYYVYYPLISTQSQADREARKSVPFQVAFKLAGAVHLPYVILNINR